MTDLLEPDDNEKTVHTDLPRIITLEQRVSEVEQRLRVIQESYELRIAELIKERDLYDQLEHWRSVAHDLRYEILRTAQEK